MSDGKGAGGPHGPGIKRLIERVDRRGFVTTAELSSVLPESASEDLMSGVVEQLFELGIDIVDGPANDDGGAGRSSDPEHVKRVRKVVMQVLARLTDCERRMLKGRFGLDPDTGVPLAEVERHLSATRERIRAIEAKALRRLNRGKPPDHDDSDDES